MQVMTGSGTYFREWRHNPCLMRPVSAIVLLVIGVVSLIGLIFQFPSLVLGFLLGPIVSKFHFVVEFLYPSSLGRWVHFTMLRIVQKTRLSQSAASNNDKNHGTHSRAAETRIEVVKNRVYVHPLPQLMDNLGYLVVCCPPPLPASATNGVGGTAQDLFYQEERKDEQQQQQHASGKQKISVSTFAEREYVGLVVDCGDSDAVVEQVAAIQKRYYNDNKNPMQIQSILSTHKHHDHTAGNKGLLFHYKHAIGMPIKLVVGGAVEGVPECNYGVANGDFVPLPKYGINDMNEVCEIEVVGTPAHTRGSVAFVLRPVASGSSSRRSQERLGAAFVFTGDTMFSAGGGVPFEADLDPNQETGINQMTANSFIKASAAAYAVERCFAEILVRSVRPEDLLNTTADNLFIFPGHEYTAELLNRQMTTVNAESCRWTKFSPHVFFATVSQLYVANHRRSLPQSSGRMLNAPSVLSREILINPNFRNLYKRGEGLVHTVEQWYDSFGEEEVSDSIRGGYGKSVDLATRTRRTFRNADADRSTESQKRWDLNGPDLRRPVFTTLYADELDEVIQALNEGTVSPATAAQRLTEIKKSLEVPLVRRRPVPRTLPSGKAIYRVLLGFCLLGSAPTAMTMSDSIEMKLSQPIGKSSDRILVSRTRLIASLYLLGLLTEENDGKKMVAYIDQLWRQTLAYVDRVSGADTSVNVKKNQISSYAGDVEVPLRDEVTLGALKWILFGIPSIKPSWFPKFCMPCSQPRLEKPKEGHPKDETNMQVQGGELVRHDVFSCLLCRHGTGCSAAAGENDTDEDKSIERSINKSAAVTEQRLSRRHLLQRIDSSVTTDEASFIEVVTPEALFSTHGEV